LQIPRLGFRQGSLTIQFSLSIYGEMPTFARFLGGPFSEEQIQNRLAREIANRHAHRVQYWPLFLLADGDFVGCCGLRPRQPEEKIFELGFHLLRAYWTKGLCEESAHPVISHAFESLAASALFAGHHPKNFTTQKALGKLGFALRTKHSRALG